MDNLPPSWLVVPISIALWFFIRERMSVIQKTDDGISKELRDMSKQINMLSVQIAKLEVLINRIDRIETRLDTVESLLRNQRIENGQLLSKP